MSQWGFTIRDMRFINALLIIFFAVGLLQQTVVSQ